MAHTACRRRCSVRLEEVSAANRATHVDFQKHVPTRFQNERKKAGKKGYVPFSRQPEILRSLLDSESQATGMGRRPGQRIIRCNLRLG